MPHDARDVGQVRYQAVEELLAVGPQCSVTKAAGRLGYDPAGQAQAFAR